MKDDFSLATTFKYLQLTSRRLVLQNLVQPIQREKGKEEENEEEKMKVKKIFMCMPNGEQSQMVLSLCPNLLYFQ